MVRRNAALSTFWNKVFALTYLRTLSGFTELLVLNLLF